MHLQISLSQLQELESQMPMGPTMLEHSTHHSKNNLSYVHSLKQDPTGSKFTLNFHRVEKQNLVLSGVKIWNGLFLDLWSLTKGFSARRLVPCKWLKLSLTMLSNLLEFPLPTLWITLENKSCVCSQTPKNPFWFIAFVFWGFFCFFLQIQFIFGGWNNLSAKRKATLLPPVEWSIIRFVENASSIDGKNKEDGELFSRTLKSSHCQTSAAALRSRNPLTFSNE